MKYLINILLTSFFLSLSLTAFGGDYDNDTSMSRDADKKSQTAMHVKPFEEANKNKDGTLDIAEARDANVEDFQEADEDQNGKLDRREYLTASIDTSSQR